MMSMSSTPSIRKIRDPPSGSEEVLRTHPLATDNVREPTEKKLTNESADRGRDLDT